MFVDAELFTFVTKLFRPVAWTGNGTGLLIGLGGSDTMGCGVAILVVWSCCVAGVGHLFATDRVAAEGATVLSNLPPDG